MRNFRSLIDITPWDKGGYSFWGLNRDQAKKLGLFFIIIGLAFADPPFSILPTDFINIWFAGVIAPVLHVSLEVALLLTYTVWAWGLILLGVWIYPYDSKRLLSGYITKFKKLISKVLRNPILLAIGLTIFYFIFQWYKKQLTLEVDTSQHLFDALITIPTEKTVLFMIILIGVILIIREQVKKNG